MFLYIYISKLPYSHFKSVMCVHCCSGARDSACALALASWYFIVSWCKRNCCIRTTISGIVHACVYSMYNCDYHQLVYENGSYWGCSCVCVFVCVYACTCVCVVCVYMRVRVCVLCVCVHVCVRVCVCVCVLCVCLCVVCMCCVCLCVCVCARMCACVLYVCCVCVCVCMCVSICLCQTERFCCTWDCGRGEWWWLNGGEVSTPTNHRRSVCHCSNSTSVVTSRIPVSLCSVIQSVCLTLSVHSHLSVWHCLSIPTFLSDSVSVQVPLFHSVTEGMLMMSHVILLSGISGLPVDSPFLSPLSFFSLYPVLLLCLSCHFSDNSSFSWHLTRKLSDIFCF